MALLKPKNKTDREQIRINIDATVAKLARAYCDFAGIKKIDEFFEQAAEFILKKDKQWKMLNRS